MDDTAAVIVRAENEGDSGAVRKLNKKAFGGNSESKLVDALRGSDGFIPALSLVAEIAGRVVGYILFSPVEIRDGDKTVPALALAPMAVLPDCQERGIGTLLVKRGLEEAARLGHRIVVVVGHPGYYPRFGFVKAGEKGLRLPFECPDEVFMALELVPGALDGARGEIVYPREFSEVV